MCVVVCGLLLFWLCCASGCFAFCVFSFVCFGGVVCCVLCVGVCCCLMLGCGLLCVVCWCLLWFVVCDHALFRVCCCVSTVGVYYVLSFGVWRCVMVVGRWCSVICCLLLFVVRCLILFIGSSLVVGGC